MKNERKYKKYKYKYLARKILVQIGAAKKKHILLDGTSSSGKTTISKLFVAVGYYHIQADDYLTTENYNLAFKKYLDTIKMDEYQDTKNRGIYIRIAEREAMVSEGKKHDLVIYDDIRQYVQNYYNDEELYVIVIYASPNQLINNIVSRINKEPRGKNIFNQFSERYTVVTNKKDKSIDTIDRISFINKLKEKLKFEFNSEEELIEFAFKFFKEIGIEDDESHEIKLRDNLKCDYLITNLIGKDIVTMFKELYDITKDYN